MCEKKVLAESWRDQFGGTEEEECDREKQPAYNTGTATAEYITRVRVLVDVLIEYEMRGVLNFSEVCSENISVKCGGLFVGPHSLEPDPEMQVV